jgi:hypothetical protein
MLKLADVVTLLNHRKNRVLRYAEAALPEKQFRAFRGLVLDEFGREGLEGDLERLMAERGEGNGTGRPIRAKEGGAHE